MTKSFLIDLDRCIGCYACEIACKDENDLTPQIRRIKVNTVDAGTIVNNVSNDPQVGAHNSHLNSLRNYASAVACSNCHTVPGSIDITGAEYARKLELPDADGTPRTLADFKGKVAVVFFCYTQCPDVFPGTLAELTEARKRLGAGGSAVVPIFVTVDPERDTAVIVKAYVASFGPDTVALRGTLEQTREAAKEFKVFFAKAPSRTPESYSMDHTAGSYVFDT